MIVIELNFVINKLLVADYQPHAESGFTLVQPQINLFEDELDQLSQCHGFLYVRAFDRIDRTHPRRPSDHYLTLLQCSMYRIVGQIYQSRINPLPGNPKLFLQLNPHKTFVQSNAQKPILKH